MAVVVFAHREGLPSEYNEGYLAGLEPVFSELQEMDIEPVRSANAEEAFTADEGVEAVSVTEGLRSSNSQIFDINDIGAVVSILHRSIKMDRLPSGLVLPPVINENSVRSLGWNKKRSYDEVIGSLGLGIPTALLADRDSAEELLDTSGEKFILKNNVGLSGKSIANVSARQARSALEDFNPDAGQKILQPFVDFGLPLPSSIMPLDRDSAETFQAHSKSLDSKEMRIYVFHTARGAEQYPVGRAINSNGDNWFFVDIDTVPVELFEDSWLIVSKVAELCGALAVYGAVDIGFGSMSGQDLERHVIEANIRSPHMIRTTAHVGVAKTLRSMFARQLKNTVELRHEGIL